MSWTPVSAPAMWSLSFVLCFVFKMSLVLNTVTLLTGDDTIYRPCHFSILYYQELLVLVLRCLPVYYHTCLSVFWIFEKGLGRGNTHDEKRSRKIIFKFNVDCIHYLSFHWLRTLQLILEIRATYRTDLPVFCKQIINWLICKLQAHCTISEGNVKQDVCSVWR